MNLGSCFLPSLSCYKHTPTRSSSSLLFSAANVSNDSKAGDSWLCLNPDSIDQEHLGEANRVQCLPTVLWAASCNANIIWANQGEAEWFERSQIFFIFFPDRVSLLCSSGCLGTRYVEWAASESQRPTCLCLPSAGIEEYTTTRSSKSYRFLINWILYLGTRKLTESSQALGNTLPWEACIFPPPTHKFCLGLWLKKPGETDVKKYAQWCPVLEIWRPAADGNSNSCYHFSFFVCLFFFFKTGSLYIALAVLELTV